MSGGGQIYGACLGTCARTEGIGGAGWFSRTCRLSPRVPEVLAVKNLEVIIYLDGQLNLLIEIVRMELSDPHLSYFITQPHLNQNV